MSPTTIAVVVGVMFLAAVLRAFLGFGDAVVAMPLLTLVVGVRIAAPLVGLVAVTLAAVLLVRLRRSIARAVATRLVVATAAGVPVGVVGLALVPETWTRRALGVVLVAYGLHRLLGGHPTTFSGPAWAWPFGFLAGCLGGAYNTNGPPIVIFASGQGWEPARLRATLQGYFIFSSAMIATSHGLAGLWTGEVATLYGISLPAVVLGLAVGAGCARRARAAEFERALFFGIVVLGALLAL